MQCSDELILMLIQAVGKLALEMGGAWRLEHAELMDAYSACLDFVEDEER